MRISDWSSDVCSSDLNVLFIDTPRRDLRIAGRIHAEGMLDVEFLTSQHAPSRNKPFVAFQRGSLILYLSDRVGASGRESGVYDISTQQPTDFDVETRRIRSLVSLRSRLGPIIERKIGKPSCRDRV